MTRAEFYDTQFKNYKFLDVDLITSYFDRYKFEGIEFFKSNLNFILVEDVKIWKSKECIEIKDFSSFEGHLYDMVRD